MAKSFSWSHSALQMFEQCAFKYYMLKVSKEVKDDFGPDALKGIEDHKHLEDRLKRNTPLPAHLAKFENLCQRLLGITGVLSPESQLALNADYLPTQWFAKNTWLRAVIDVLIVDGPNAYIFDWKTGKVKNDYDQLKIFALVVFAVYPMVQKVSTRYIWLKTKEVTPSGTEGVYLRENAPAMWKEQEARVKALTDTIAKNNWVGTTSGLCKNYCPVSKAGKCPYYTGS